MPRLVCVLLIPIKNIHGSTTHLELTQRTQTEDTVKIRCFKIELMRKDIVYELILVFVTISVYTLAVCLNAEWDQVSALNIFLKTNLLNSCKLAGRYVCK